jgi:hypothetical protein
VRCSQRKRNQHSASYLGSPCFSLLDNLVRRMCHAVRRDSTG